MSTEGADTSWEELGLAPPQVPDVLTTDVNTNEDEATGFHTAAKEEKEETTTKNPVKEEGDDLVNVDDVEVPTLEPVDDKAAEAAQAAAIEAAAAAAVANATETTVTTAATEADTPPAKKRGRPLGSKSKSNKKSKTEGEIPDYAEWEELKNKIRENLRSMPSDVCFVKALELKQLAITEVQRQSSHLLSAMNMMSQSASVPLAPAMVDASNPKRGADWMDNYHQLVQFYRTNGHCNVPPSNPQLYRWVNYQKETREKLNDEKTSLLNQIGFEWDLGYNDAVVVAEAEGFPLIQPQTPTQTSDSSNHPAVCFRLNKANLGPSCDPDPKNDHVPVPDFRQLCNFPNAKHYNKCVMCNESSSKIPKQNKGVCNTCDEAVWMLVSCGMQIKWCKGCKNFRKWIAFGLKGHSTKCERCRSQQAERYAQNKKDKSLHGIPLHI